MKMNIPRKCWPMGIGFVLSALMAATSALGATKPEARETGPPLKVPAFLQSAG